MDRWMLARLNGLVKSVTQHYEDFEFHRAWNELYNFCVVDLSSFYLNVLKDRMYCDATDSVERRAGQTVMYNLTMSLVKLYAPILVHTTEEIWSHIPGNKEAESVHLALWPKIDEKLFDDELESRWTMLLKVRNEAARELEKLRAAKTIGSSLEGRVELHTKDEKLAALLKAYEAALPTILVVSQAAVKAEMPDGAVAGIDLPKLFVLAVRSENKKCERCWQYRDTVGQNTPHPTLCTRCAEVVSKL
jgi:isoleucyl-tRNA synthetase